MIVLLRLIGVMNAALWFGAGIFFTFVAAPALFSRPIKDLFGPETAGVAFAGLIAQALLERYFVLQYICASVALLQQVAEWLYLGKALQRASLGLLLGVFSLGLVNGLGLQPKLKNLHSIRFSAELYHRELYSPAQKEQATQSFRSWHHLAVAINLLQLGGLTLYLWNVTSPGNGPRFLAGSKFRS